MTCDYRCDHFQCINIRAFFLVLLPELSSPELSSPELSSPELSSPELSSPELSSPELSMSYSGYVCVPYLHTDKSVNLRDYLVNSDNIKKLFFVTGTFSSESIPYFSDSTNHYLLAKFKDSTQMSKDLDTFNQDKTSFMFNVDDDLFQREVQGETNFVSVYYLEDVDDGEDLQQIANLLLKRDKIEIAWMGNMKTFCLTPAKFTFPYSANIVVIEVASQKSYQSLKKYCDQTRRDINRKGLVMTNLLNFSVLDNLK